MIEWIKQNPLKAAAIGAAAVVVATVLFGSETAQGWIEAIWRQYVGGEASE